MRRLKQFMVAILLVSSIFTTGCDASKIMDVITKVAEGIQKAMPAIKEVIDTVKGVVGNDDNTNTAANNNTDNQQPAETNQTNDANVVVIDPDKEEVDPGAGQNTTNGQGGTESVEELIASANITTPYEKVGTVSNLAEAAEIKNKYGITLLNGKNWKEQWESGTAANWTSEQVKKLDEILSTIPAGFRRCTSGFSMQEKITENESGGDIGGLGGDPIILSKGMTGGNEDDFKHLVSHEMTHEFQRKNPDIARQWASAFWPNGKPAKSSITDYGNTNFMEDMAECVAEFFKNPEKLKQHDPVRYEFVKNKIWK